jgi:hypothetical protein
MEPLLDYIQAKRRFWFSSVYYRGGVTQKSAIGQDDLRY